MTVFHLYKKYILGTILIIVLGLLVFFGKDEYEKMTGVTKKIEEKKEIKKVVEIEKTPVKEDVSTSIKVDIKGAVMKPGVYEIKHNLRVIDVINLAGGLRKDADTTLINLSQFLKDSMVIIVNTKKEVLNLDDYLNLKKEQSNLCSEPIKNDACIESEVKISNKININTASITDLMKLEGIGESKAKTIIKYRETNKFITIDDLKNVEGIGDSLFAKIKENITV